MQSARPYAADAEYHSSAVAGRQQRDPERRERAGLDHRAGVASQPGELGVLGAIVGDQQRQLAVARRPDRDRQVVAEHPDDDPVERSLDERLLEPRRRPVAGRRQHRLLAERPGGALRVARIAHDDRVAVMVGQLELVLQAREPVVGQVQHPAAVLACELRVGERQVRAQTDRCIALLGVVDAQAVQHRAGS